MNAIVGAINLGGFVATPRDYITTRLGLNKTSTAWEFLQSKYAKHFGFGIEYRWICNAVKDASGEMLLERAGNGPTSRFYTQYRKINRFFVNLFDRRISHSDVMAVAGTQLIGSNLNGIDYGVPLFVDGISPDDMRFVFIPSHGDHNNTTKAARARRSLSTHVTEVSFACGPKIKESTGRSVVFKSLKVLPQKASNILLDWGYTPDKIKSLSPSERVQQVFLDAYRPDNPMLGRIEKRAALYLT